jgi:hypothetical protein
VRRELPARHDLPPDGRLLRPRDGLRRLVGQLQRVQPAWRPVPVPPPQVNAPGAGLQTRHDLQAWLRLLLDD